MIILFHSDYQAALNLKANFVKVVVIVSEGHAFPIFIAIPVGTSGGEGAVFWAAQISLTMESLTNTLPSKNPAKARGYWVFCGVALVEA